MQLSGYIWIQGTTHAIHSVLCTEGIPPPGKVLGTVYFIHQIKPKILTEPGSVFLEYTWLLSDLIFVSNRDTDTSFYYPEDFIITACRCLPKGDVTRVFRSHVYRSKPYHRPHTEGRGREKDRDRDAACHCCL